MNIYEVVNNGVHTGIMIEAMNQPIAFNKARKMGYRIFTLEDQWEKTVGKPEYEMVQKYFLTMESIAHDIKNDDTVIEDIFSGVVSITNNYTIGIEKPSQETIEKATRWAKTTGKVAYDDFQANLRKYRLV